MTPVALLALCREYKGHINKQERPKWLCTLICAPCANLLLRGIQIACRENKRCHKFWTTTYMLFLCPSIKALAWVTIPLGDNSIPIFRPRRRSPHVSASCPLLSSESHPLTNFFLLSSSLCPTFKKYHVLFWPWFVVAPFHSDFAQILCYPGLVYFQIALI